MKINYYSQYWKIIRAFQDHQWYRLWVKFFQKWSYMVWWKANSRICELVKKWFLERSPIDDIGSKNQHFAQYTITEKWKQLDIPKPTRFERFIHFFTI